MSNLRISICQHCWCRCHTKSFCNQQSRHSSVVKAKNQTHVFPPHMLSTATIMQPMPWTPFPQLRFLITGRRSHFRHVLRFSPGVGRRKIKQFPAIYHSPLKKYTILHNRKRVNFFTGIEARFMTNSDHNPYCLVFIYLIS